MLPLRTCRGCHQQFQKNLLFRIVRTPKGEVTLDESGKAGGRGIYLCKKKRCFKAVLPKKKKSPLSYFLKASISPEFFAMLEKYYEQFS